MTTTSGIRALCAELVNELHGYKALHPEHGTDLIDRARQELATPPPEPPVAEAESKPVAWMYRGEPSFDGTEWREIWKVTIDKRLAEYKAKPDQPIPLFSVLYRAALATPPPEPPTEQKSSIDELIAGCKPLDPEMAEVLTTTARWRLYGEEDSATPPPAPLRPIPVSERLPGPGDCADELCWMWESDINGHEDLGHWLLEHRNWVSDPEADCTHWLPHNAIPFPEVTQ